jgi:capsular polysaccharide biosynthesis protein
MELMALWKMFVRRWWLIVIPVVVAGALVVPDLLNPPAGGFTATVRLTAAQPPSGAEPTYEDASQMPWTASEYLINSLTAWVTTGSFAEEVSAALDEAGMAVAPAAVRGSLAADNARSVMAVFVSGGDAAQVEAIANAVITVMRTRSQAYFPQLAAQPADVIALDDVALAPVAPGLLTRFQPLLKVAVALLAGIALAALVEYLDDSIYGRADVEALDIPVLGEIPRYRA